MYIDQVKGCGSQIILGNTYHLMLRPGVVQSADPSEHDLDGVAMDYVITNNGTISDLRHAVKHCFHMMLATCEANKGDAAHGT